MGSACTRRAAYSQGTQSLGRGAAGIGNRPYSSSSFAFSLDAPKAVWFPRLVHDSILNWVSVPNLGLSVSEKFGKIKEIRAEILDEYTQPHCTPWVIAYSGGKDSTLVVQLTIEAMLSLHPDERRRTVHLVYNDTLVESPIFQQYAVRALEQISRAVQTLALPVEVTITTPPTEESFWVNLLGKGYPAPNRTFRWCMDRLKIRPSSQYITKLIRDSGSAILLLGVRRAESSARQQRIDNYSEENDHVRLIPNSEIPGCLIYRPIKEASTEEVWDYLREIPPPWGSTATLSMLEVYQDAGMCNATQSCALMDESTVLESSSILARFGCWTCTVVKRDRSLEALVDSGYPELQPLITFRERLREVSDTPEFRSKTRRNGVPGLGPLTYEAREMLLDELISTQEATGLELISAMEIVYIREQWERDKTLDVIRRVQ